MIKFCSGIIAPGKKKKHCLSFHLSHYLSRGWPRNIETDEQVVMEIVYFELSPP